MADFTNRNADETKQFILTFDENGGSPEYTKIEDANGVDRTAEVVDLLGINDKEDADPTILKEGDVEDSLNSTSTTKPLSANQGKQLNDEKASLSAINNDPNFYEEGTWTPVVTSGISSVSYSQRLGGYTKVGDLVYIECRLSFDGGTGDGSIFRVAGIPFTSSSLSGSASPSGISISLNSINSDAITGQLFNDQIDFFEFGGSVYSFTTGASGSNFRFSAWYKKV